MVWRAKIEMFCTPGETPQYLNQQSARFHSPRFHSPKFHRSKFHRSRFHSAKVHRPIQRAFHDAPHIARILRSAISSPVPVRGSRFRGSPFPGVAMITCGMMIASMHGPTSRFARADVRAIPQQPAWRTRQPALTCPKCRGISGDFRGDLLF